MVKKIMTGLLCLVFIATACNNQQEDNDSKKQGIGGNGFEGQQQSTDSTGGTEPLSSFESPAPAAPTDRRIIKHADLGLEVKSFSGFFVSMRKKIQGLGGYIMSEQQEETETRIQNTVSIRVPVDQFENALDILTSNTGRVVERSVTSQDVTAEIADTKGRIESKKKIRERYLQLLDHAKKMDDVLTIQNEIDEVQSEVESSMGRSSHLSSVAAFSTINLRYFQPLEQGSGTTDTPGFGDSAWSALSTGWTWVSRIIVKLLVLWPLAMITLVAWYLYRKTRKPAQKIVTGDHSSGTFTV